MVRDDAMAVAPEWPRMGFQEAMAMEKLPVDDQGDPSVKRFVSRQPAWKPGAELPWDNLFRGFDGQVPMPRGRGVYGRHVFAQASLAAARAIHPCQSGRGCHGRQRLWLQEASWPRVSAGRCIQESKIWSPEGKHVASAYQDGIAVPAGKL